MDIKMMWSKYGAKILTGLGVTGLIGAGVLASINTPKCLDIWKSETEHYNGQLPFKEKAKIAAKYYGPSLALTICSVGSIIFAQVMNDRKFTAVATAAQLSQEALALYKSKVIETLGEKEEAKVEDAVAAEHLKKAEPLPPQFVISTGGKALYLEPVSGEYFESDKESIRAAANDLGKTAIDGEPYVSLLDFFYSLNVTPKNSDRVDSYGWAVAKYGRIPKLKDIYYQEGFDGRPCGVIMWETDPTKDYWVLS